MRSVAIAVPILLAAQAVLVHVVSSGERPPDSPDLARFPDSFGRWQKLGEDPIEPDVQQQLHADRLLSRSYIDRHTMSNAGVFVAWFRSQRSGLSQPHSPQVCLPGSGWIPEARDDVTLATAAGSIAANRYVVVNHGQRAVVLYWYQMRHHAIEGEWAAKFWTIASAVSEKRTDTALVRIVVMAPSQGADRATETAINLGRDLYPELLRVLPQ